MKKVFFSFFLLLSIVQKGFGQYQYMNRFLLLNDIDIDSVKTTFVKTEIANNDSIYYFLINPNFFDFDTVLVIKGKKLSFYYKRKNDKYLAEIIDYYEDSIIFKTLKNRLLIRKYTFENTKRRYPIEKIENRWTQDALITKKIYFHKNIFGRRTFKIEYEYNYVNDKLQGNSFRYLKNGKLFCIYVFNQGQWCETMILNKKGKVQGKLKPDNSCNN